ncbi:MAG: hypothetical protein KKE17_14775 [Proteobacteria bacterium]|nr:hypothetical protein [Pseudomonadota bacterium]MBU1711263.1 hypothetical protein [Pseudomonadota bacterium]
MKAIQYFSDEYLETCRNMSAEQIVDFLDDFHAMHASPKDRSRLISIKIPESLLGAFRRKADAHGVKYQTKIKDLMRAWLE